MQAGRDVWWDDAVAAAATRPAAAPEIVDAEHPLFILYTSGSTGKPKGVLHTTAGYLAGTHVSTRVRLRSAPGRRATGAPPTSAGSPATATSSTARSPTAPPA
jgi:acyl-coenzyme A synthetase/AMP-(fatty) acid ligase